MIKVGRHDDPESARDFGLRFERAMGPDGFVLAVFMQLSLAFLQRCLGLRAEETRLSTTEATRFEALKTLTIVHAGAYHSHLYEVDSSDNICSRTKKEFRLCYGGMARHQTILKRAKLLPASVSLFTGDMFRGSVWFRLLGWDVPTTALQMLQFDALTLGEHEFYRGPLGVERVLKTLSEKQSAAVVLCNGDFSHESTLAGFPVLKSLVLTRGNVRVGLIGYVRDDLNETSQPGRKWGRKATLIRCCSMC
ncbi:hypothetical protein HPB47_025015 [Ixodes persulcatus]|uniref:Uncharacterized protein n=1 Tax=Ixodes persulcatus TaxID=34615 RepID=A0AC60Q2P2_IXOPE|nr:hypothetical protein HPB47_025015 [Ixodes persulcatus]